MALLSFILGIIGNATAILVLLSPMPTFWLIYKRKATECFSPQPYLFSLLSSMMWTYYGILKQGGILVITINATACAFQSFYIAFYVWFSNKLQREKTGWALLVIVCFFAATVLFTRNLVHGKQPLVAVGLLCTIFSASTNAAPLSIIRTVVKTRSVQYMPFSLSLCLFLNGATWLAYGLSLKDVYLTVTNAIGLALGILQLSVYMYYELCGIGVQVSGNKEVDGTATTTTTTNTNTNIVIMNDRTHAEDAIRHCASHGLPMDDIMLGSGRLQKLPILCETDIDAIQIVT